MNDDFIKYGSLRSFNMRNNKIKVIQEQAFNPLTNLKELDLLSAAWFCNLFSLENLNLLGNRYQTLGQSTLFQSMKTIKVLRFGGSFLQLFRKQDFLWLRGLEEFEEFF